MIFLLGRLIRPLFPFTSKIILLLSNQGIPKMNRKTGHFNNLIRENVKITGGEVLKILNIIFTNGGLFDLLSKIDYKEAIQ